MKEVTIDSVRERIANLELQANYSPIGGRLNEFEIACLRELLELLALREKTRRAVAYLKAVNDRSDPEFKDVLVDYAIRELDGNDHLSAPPVPVVPDEMTPEMMREVQLHSELGAYAAANLSGAYGLFDEFWKVACRAAMLAALPAPVAAGWIACSERMPDEGAEVYIFCDGEWVLEAQYREGDFYDVVRDGSEIFETVSRCVSHWQLRPQRPAAPGKEG